MTRKEQIKEYLKERNIPIDSLEANSIIEGINWADKHPKDGFISVDKACNWLENNMYYHDCGNYDVITHSSNTIEEMIDNFKKEMEE